MRKGREHARQKEEKEREEMEATLADEHEIQREHRLQKEARAAKEKERSVEDRTEAEKEIVAAATEARDEKIGRERSAFKM